MVNMFLLIATVAAVGRTTMPFVIAILLAVPAVWFQYHGLTRDDDWELAESWMFSAALYFIATVYLLRYVFQPRVMTADKLFGAAAAYLMLGVLWAYIYAIVGYFYPSSYMVLGQPGRLVFSDALYLSMTVLTSTGFGDISPVTPTGARRMHGRADRRRAVRRHPHRPAGGRVSAEGGLRQRRFRVGPAATGISAAPAGAPARR
jgi:hypothetical protein